MPKTNRKPLLQAFWKLNRVSSPTDLRALNKMKSIFFKLQRSGTDAKSLTVLQKAIDDREGRISYLDALSESNLENLLEGLLKESQPIERPEAMQDFAAVAEKPFSLDQAIDKYLVQYEREAIPTSEMFEHARVDGLVDFLFEQEEEDLGDEGDEGGELDLGGGEDLDLGGGADLGGDEGLGDLGGDEPPAEGEGEDTGEQPVVNTPKINLQDFTRSVARLVNNLPSLIDMNTLILNRAEKYIQSNYDERTAREMMEILDTSYDLRPTENEVHQSDVPKYPEPRTGVTGPVGG